MEHKKKKVRLRIIGCIVLCIGLGCLITGLIDFFINIGNFGMPKLFWMTFIGFPGTAVGLFLVILSFQKEINRYMKDETMPVVHETLRDPALGDAIHQVKSNAKGSLSCASCGKVNAADGVYCIGCGAPLQKICGACSAENPLEANFCARCAKPL